MNQCLVIARLEIDVWRIDQALVVFPAKAAGSRNMSAGDTRRRISRLCLVSARASTPFIGCQGAETHHRQPSRAAALRPSLQPRRRHQSCEFSRAYGVGEALILLAFRAMRIPRKER